jgi:hypothetical protein
MRSSDFPVFTPMTKSSGTSESELNAVTRVPGTNNTWAVGDIFKNGWRFPLTLFHG